MMEVNAKGMYYRDLNRKIKSAIAEGEKEVFLRNINGQRYIGGGIRGDAKISIEGVPGNDLAAFMDGPTVIVNTNAQDTVGNTMNEGKIVIYGDAGDVLGYGMRGGKLFIQGNAGYRTGIHMKTYKEKSPVIIVGGVAGDFLGEYMAGGNLIVLGLNKNTTLGNYAGTGMHGGAIYLRSNINGYKLSKEVAADKITVEDERFLEKHIKEYCEHFNLEHQKILSEKFVKLIPLSHRPYGKMYTW